MRSRLISRHTLEGFVARYDVEQMVSHLAQSDYATDIALAMTRFPGAECVEEAVTSHLARISTAIRSFYDGAAGTLVTLLLSRYDRHNVTAALRGVAARARPDETARAWLTAGAIGEPLLRELASQADLKHAVDLMATWRLPYAGAVSDALWRYGQESAGPLERELSRAFFADALRGAGSGGPDAALVHELLAREVDALNLSSVLRLCAGSDGHADGEGAAELLAGGARLTPGFLAPLCALGDVGTVVGRLGDTPYGPVLDSAMPSFRETGRASVLERALERHFGRWSLSLGRGDPLGIGIVIGYLAGKTREVVNLRLIARSIWLGVSSAAIFDQLQLPEA